MSEDESPPAEEDDFDATNLKTNDDEEKQHEASDLEHEKEDSQELEAARKERMDLMAAELKREREMQEKEKERSGEEVGTFDKFQYLIGQSEVFAHFLAGECIVYYLLVCLCWMCWIGDNERN